MIRPGHPRRKGGDEAETASGRELPIFFDPTARRRYLVRILGAALSLAFLIWSFVFGVNLYVLAKLQTIESGEGARVYPFTQLIENELGHLAAAPGAQGGGTANPGLLATPPPSEGALGGTRPAVKRSAPPSVVYAYLPYWPDWNYVALAEALPAIDVLLPQWYRLDAKTLTLTPLGLHAPHRQAVAQLLRYRSPRDIMPVVDIAGGTQDAQLIADLTSPPKTARMAEEIARLATQEDYRGLCLDLSGIPTSSYEGAFRLFAGIKERFGNTGRQTCLVAPIGSALWDDKPLTSVIDRAVVLGFRDANTMPLPGPLAPQDWFSSQLASLVGKLDPAKLVLALGATGYDWTNEEHLPREIGYAEAMRLADLYDAAVEFNGASLNTTFSYSKGRNRHTVWLLDAASAYNEMLAAARHNIGDIAVWPLTDADPSLWTLLVARHRMADPAVLLRRVSIVGYVAFEGAGAFQKLLHTPKTGMRTIRRDPASGDIVGVSYSRLPQPYTVLRYGRGRKGTIALTFDDGPDPAYTEPILKILKAYHVPATFFVVGRNALEAPGLISKMAAEGHEIGVHTFFHPALQRVPAWRVRFELSATERLIASLTGRKTLLFRAPYGRTEGPLTGNEAWATQQVEKYGYLVVGADIAPPDWTHVSAQAIIALVKREADPHFGNVLALHDAGGDRTATLKALPGIIRSLRKEGYSFVPLSSFIGKSRAELMPVDDTPMAMFDAASFEFIRTVAIALRWLFWAVVALGIGRALFVVALAHLRKRHPAPVKDYMPPVTVVIPAFCEEPVIARTISAVLNSDYPDLDVLVVDDGSTDRTSAAARKACGGNPKAKIVTQPNGGKFSALNHAYAQIRTDIVVGIDADTVIQPDAIGRLVRHFQDPRIGAVAGNVKVANRRSLMTKLQSLEYITAQNIDRRAAEVLNGILVVPGAIGAWRREAVEKAGYYSPQTLAEDADLTVSIVRAGYRVVFEESAIASTEAPETVRQFLRQRLRWMLGMLQTAWKHRGAIAERQWIGLISIPELFLFGIIMAAFAPIADIMLAAAILNGAVNFITVPWATWNLPSLHILAAYGGFLVADTVVAMLAFRLEPSEDKGLLLLLPFQRFLYRQLLYLSAIRAVLVALSGRLMRWQKITHAADIEEPVADAARAARRQIQLTPKDTVRQKRSRRPSLRRSGNHSP